MTPARESTSGDSVPCWSDWTPLRSEYVPVSRLAMAGVVVVVVE